MGNIELRITLKDWLGVLVIGSAFSTILSLFGYPLMGLSFLDGALYGVTLGFLIALFSLLFITAMNRYILPGIEKKWWNAIAAFFSFSAGFFGTAAANLTLGATSIAIIPMIDDHPFQSAAVIGVLTYLIGALIYRFVKTRNEKEYVDTLFVQSRLSSLETQLNPHFLYNALNSLAELIHQDPAKAEAAVIKISTFLRNTMVETPLITLEQELRNVQDYIDLENIRFSGRIALSLTTDPLHRHRMVPKFSIQLLCENALKHGFIRSSEPFVISIRSYIESDLHIEVSNNGKPVTSKRFGIGLGNLEERLRHLCQGSLAITRLDPPAYTLTLKDCHANTDRR